MKKRIILVAVLAVVALVALVPLVLLPSLRRARASANSAFAVGQVRDFAEAQKAYAAKAGSYGSVECLTAPAQKDCLTGYGPGEPAFLDAESARAERAGYRRVFVGGSPRPTPRNLHGLEAYCYSAVPVEAGSTGTQSFAADHTGKLCVDEAGGNLCDGPSLREGCRELR